MKHLKYFEKSFYEEDEGIIESYLHGLFGDYLMLPPGNTKNLPFNTQGYSTVIERDDVPVEDYDYENLPPKYKYYTVKKNEIKIFELKLNYTEGYIEIGKIYHRNHYIDLIKENWEIITSYLYEKMKNDLI